MSFEVEEIELLLQVARDASLGVTLEERLTAVTETLSVLVPNTSLSAIVIDRSLSGPAEGGVHAFFRNGDPATVREYAEHYMQFDPCPVAGVANPGRVGTLSEFVASSQFGKDPFTADFLPQLKIKHIMGAVLPMPNGNMLSFAIHRDPAMGDFSQRERQLLELAGDDLARAAFGSILRAKLLQTANAISPTHRVGVLVFSASGDVLEADSGGRALSSLHCNGRTPIDLLVEDAKCLAASPLKEGDSRVRLIPLDRRDVLRATYTALETQSEGNVLCVLEFLPLPRNAFEEIALEAGLTPREREVAALVVEGLGSRHIGRTLGIATPTVGVHLTRIYRKTGVAGRTELARLLSRANPESREQP